MMMNIKIFNNVQTNVVINIHLLMKIKINVCTNVMNKTKINIIQLKIMQMFVVIHVYYLKYINKLQQEA